MQFPKCLFLAMTAGTALSATALAQQSDTVIPNDRAIPVQRGMIQGGSYAPAGGYSQRVDLDVYDVGIPSESGGGWASSGVNVYDDVVVGGPYTSNANPLILNGIAMGFIVPANATAADDHLYTRLSFYPDHTPTGPVNPYGGTPVVWNLDWGAGWSAAAGFISYYPASVTFNGSVTLTNTDVFNGGATDKTLGLKKELFLDAAFTRYANDWQIVRRTNIPAVGTSMNLVVGTSDFAAWFTAVTGVTNGDIAFGSFSGGTAANNRATYTALQGTGFAVAAPTPVEFDFGALADGTTNRTNITVANAGYKWFKVTLAQGAVDGLGKFFDLDGEGSGADFSIGVFDGTDNTSATWGQVVAFDADTGSGTNPMLSFGMGRRAAVGDGRQYDGRNFFNGAAGLNAGTYYIAVAPAGSTFSNGFVVTPGPTGGTAQLHLRTNVNGAPLAASVAPTMLAGDDLTPSPLVAPGQQFVAAAMNAYEPRWIHFTTCRDATDAAPVTIDYTGSDVAGFSMTMFNGAGNFQFQVTSAANGLPPSTVFNSSNPLPAGSYYMALSYQGVQTQPNNPTSDGRWHLRGTTGNNGFNFGGAVLVSNADCALACGTSDFNGDGDFGTDADIEAFFACLAGNCCATCYAGGSDFNADGDFGTDADIESFFRVLAGGPC
jgi:hypothetical protein